MRTKLLKKARKKFSIIRWDKIVDPKNTLYFYRNDLPIWVVQENFFCNKHIIKVCKSKKVAMDILFNVIKEEYFHTKTSRHNRDKLTKVWYNERRS